MADAKAIVEKLYQAFNDSGFLGLGGTDEEGALEALRMAKDQGIMKEVDALYAKTYPDEPNLKDEIDDELGGDDFDAAMKLYNEGMQAQPKAQPATAAGAGKSAGGGTGKTPEPQLRVSGTLTPNANTIDVCLLDFERKPLPGAKCRLADFPDKIYTSDEAGMVTLPIPNGKKSLEIQWAIRKNEGSENQQDVYFQQTFHVDFEGTDDSAISKQLSNLGFQGEDLAEQLANFQAFFGKGNDPDAARSEVSDWIYSGKNPDQKLA